MPRNISICSYCGNPTPHAESTLTATSHNGAAAGIPGTGVEANEDTSSAVTAPVTISCRVCGRTYEIMAGRQNRTFADKLLTNLKFSDTFLSAMKAYNLKVGMS